MSRIQANLLLTAIAIIWGSAFVAQAHGMDHLGPMMFTGLRFLVGALVILPLVLRERRSPAVPPLRAADRWKITGLGLLLMSGAALQQIGIQYTSVTNAGFLTALYVPLVPLLGWALLRHRPHWSVWPGALACLVGAFLLSGAHELSISLGDTWIIASSLPWAVHVLLVGLVADRLNSPFRVAAGQFLVCGLVALAWGLVMEPWTWDGIVAAAGPLLYTGVLSVGVAFTAQVVAQRYAHAADAAIILSSETLFAATFGYLLMGDRLGPGGLVGCGLILLAMLGIQLLPMLRLLKARIA